MTDLLKMDPKELEARAASIETMVTAFSDGFDRENSAMAGTDWQGAAGLAYKDMFNDARGNFKKVEESLRGCATMLRNLKDGLQQADLDAARAVGKRY